ncbi:MAG: hypothetical protein WBE47_02950, partial [Candidatus Acidiferrales bacterium]
MLHSKVFKTLNNFREKGIGDFGDDQTKNAAPAGNKRPGLGIGIISEFLDDLPNAAGKLRSDGGYAIDGARDCGDGYLGASGYFMNTQRFSPGMSN